MGIFGKNIDMIFVTEETITMKPTNIISKDTTEILTDSSLMLIKGVSGSGKSRLCLNILAGLLGQSDDLGFKYTICPDDKYIYYLSTEMSTYHLKRRRLKLLESIPSHLHSKLLTANTYGTDDILLELKKLFTEKEPYVVIIDQVGDLVSSINEERLTNQLVHRLHSLTQETGVGLITVLHQNEGSANSSKARGHLGSSLEQKAISSIAVSKSNNSHTITSTKIREGANFRLSVMFNTDTGRFITNDNKVTSLFSKIDFPISSGDLKDFIMQETGKSVTTAENIIKTWVEKNKIDFKKEGRTNIYSKK